METVSRVLHWASEQLSQAGVENPSVDAERLVQHVLGAPRLDLYLNPDRPLTPSESARLRDALRQRCSRIPLQHLTGETEFWSLPFFVNDAVLIPRPETESLVEAVLAQLRDIPHPRIVDIGTGSGCIAVSLAHERPEGLVVATDLSPAALRVARANVLRNKVHVRLVAGDLIEPFGPSVQFDAIVSNPPYIRREGIETLQPEVRDHEPRLALDGGEDGFSVHRRLVACAGRHLRPGGWLALEVGWWQIGAVVKMLRGSEDFETVTRYKDLTGIERVAVARRR
ncbi:MAG: peptide chain release factor N(5)-glutamine methyltransferase [Candidatus Latescibacteria bacterium]|nr:peptide chain release factor N(5)-glutamine methyltransferase [Candidatus Latescibacterota bacterium]